MSPNPASHPGQIQQSSPTGLTRRTTLGRLVPYPVGVAAQHRVLMPEHQQFSVLRQVLTECQDSQAEYPAN
jgi:hypothetical protein